MTPEEQQDLIDYVTNFGASASKHYPKLRDDVIGAALLGASIAFASPDLPADPEGRRKFVGQAAWNLIRRELSFFLRPQPIPFTDLSEDYPIEVCVEGRRQTLHDPEAQVDWEDMLDAVASSLSDRDATIFRLTYGDVPHTRAEVGAQVHACTSGVQYRLKKIRRNLKQRLEQERDLG